MAQIVGGKVQNKDLTLALQQCPLRNYCAPKLTDIQSFVRNETLERYCQKQILFIYSYFRMRKNRHNFYRLGLIMRHNYITFLLAFFFKIWRFKAKRCVKNNFYKSRQIFFRWSTLYQARRYLLIIEKAIIRKRVHKYYLAFKAYFNLYRRLLRYAQQFYKNRLIKMQLVSFHILIARRQFQYVLKAHFQYLPETGELDFYAVKYYVEMQIKHYPDYFVQLTDYYEDLMHDLYQKIYEGILRALFIQMIEILQEKLERAAKRRQLIRETNIVELSFCAWKDISINRHFLLGKYMFMWKRGVFHTESNVKKALALKYKARCLQKWVIFKNTAFLYKEIGYSIIRHSLNVRFLCYAIQDCCCGLTTMANGEFLWNETLAMSPYYKDSDARKAYMQIKFLLMLRREVEYRRSFYRLILLCNVFQHYAYVLLAFKLLSVKVASITQYRVLQLNNKHIFGYQAVRIITSEDVLNIYYLALSGNNGEQQQQILSQYPPFIAKYVRMILNFNMKMLLAAFDYWQSEQDVFCDAQLFFRVVLVARTTNTTNETKDKEKKYYHRIQLYSRIIASNMLQALYFVKYNDKNERFSKFYFVYVSQFVRQQYAPISPFNWLTRGHQRWMKYAGANSLRVVFKNNNILPYVQYFLKHYKANELAHTCEDLVHQFTLKSHMFHGRDNASELSQANKDILDRILEQFNVPTERRQWVVNNFRCMCEKSEDVTHNDIMKNAEELIAVSDEEVLFALYNCKVVQQVHSATYTQLYQMVTSRTQRQSQDPHQRQQEQLKLLEDYLRDYIREYQLAKEVTTRNKLAAKIYAKSNANRTSKMQKNAYHFVIRKLKRSRKSRAIGRIINATVNKIVQYNNLLGELQRAVRNQKQRQKETQFIKNGTVNSDAKSLSAYYPPMHKQSKQPSRATSTNKSYRVLLDQIHTSKKTKKIITGSISYAREHISDDSQLFKTPPRKTASYCDSNTLNDNSDLLVLSDASYPEQASQIQKLLGAGSREQIIAENDAIKVTQGKLAKQSVGVSRAYNSQPPPLKPVAGVSKASHSGVAYKPALMQPQTYNDAQRLNYKPAPLSSARRPEGYSVARNAPRQVTYQSEDNDKEMSGVLNVCKNLGLDDRIRGAPSDSRKLDSPSAYPRETLNSLYNLPYYDPGQPAEYPLSEPMNGANQRCCKPAREINGLLQEIPDTNLRYMAQELIYNPVGFLRGASQNEQLKNLLTYLAFSNVSADDAVHATPAIPESQRARLAAAFSDEMRGKLYSMVKLGVIGAHEYLPISETTAPQLKRPDLSYYVQYRSELPVVVRSFAAVFQYIDLLSDAVFDVANIKIRYKLKKEIQPTFVRFLRSRMTRCGPNHPISCNRCRFIYPEPRVRARNTRNYLALPYTWTIKQTNWTSVGMTVKTLYRPFFGHNDYNLQITDADLQDIMEFQVSTDTEYPDRYLPHHGPGKRVY